MTTDIGGHLDLTELHELAGDIRKLPCRGESDLFIADDGDDEELSKYAFAKTLCAACPIAAQCLEYALRNNEPYGVWGGMTRLDRQKLRKLSRAA